VSEQPQQSPREHILEAVITCIEKYGIDNLTTRKIAEEAGTNIASINYYFRSKDLAVAEALSMAVKNSDADLRAIAAEEGRSFEEVSEALLVYLIEGSLRYPGVTMAHMYPVLMDRRVDTPGAQLLRGAFELLAGRAEREYPDRPAGAVRLALGEVLSAAALAMLAPNLFQPLTPIGLAQPDGPAALARYLGQVFVRSLEIPPSGST
jgi:AcrR family transcriptional regulator